MNHFNFGLSLFDLWLLALVRVTVFSALVLALCCSKVKILRILKKFSILCTFFLAVLFCYSVAKLLASFEFYSDGSPVHGRLNSSSANSSSPDSLHSHAKRPFHPWLWGMLGWVALALGVYSVAYACITAIPLKHSKSMSVKESTEGRNGSGNVQDGESTPLLNNVALDASGEDGHGANVGEEEEEVAPSMSSIRVMWRLLRYCRPDAHLYVLGFTFLVISSSTMSFIPYYTGQVINHIAIKPSMKRFEQAIMVMSIVTVVSAITAGLRGGIMTAANVRLVIRIRGILFQSITRQEIAFFDTTETGDLTSRLTADTTKMADQIGLNLNIFLRNMVQCIGSVVFMVQLTWKLTVVTLVGIPLITIVTWYFGEYFKVSGVC